MMTPLTAFAIALLSVSATATEKPQRAGLKVREVSQGDVEQALTSELLDAAVARLRDLEDSFRQTFATLPKNAHGNLGHQAVRYALHRRFVQQHGWFIRGLEPSNDTWHHESPSTNGAKLKEWVPSFLQ